MALQQAYKNYTKGSPDMDGRTFGKILKDTCVLDKKFTQVDADLIFAKIKEPGAKKIVFADFKRGLNLVAEKKDMDFETLSEIIAEGGSEGPILYGTKANNVRLYDDKSTFTGVHKAGGPTTVDTGRVQVGNISEICDRSTPTVRGVNTKILASKTGDSK